MILDNRLLIINTKYTNLFENLPFGIVMVVCSKNQNYRTGRHDRFHRNYKKGGQLKECSYYLLQLDLGWRLHHRRATTWTCKTNHTYLSKYLLEQSREISISKVVSSYIQYLQETYWQKGCVSNIVTRYNCSFWLLCFLDNKNRKFTNKDQLRIQNLV